MRKIIFIGPVGSGKTTLIRSLNGETGRVMKTQSLEFGEGFIDTPGEFLEIRRLIPALVVSSAECDAVALLLGADAEENPYPPGIGGSFNKPAVGVVTKIDLPAARVERAAAMLRTAGAEEIIALSAYDGRGMDTLTDYRGQALGGGWRRNMGEEIISAGLDVGTTTTQLLFTRLTLRNTAAFSRAPRIVIAEKEIIHTGRVHFTPLLSERRIDGKALKEIVVEEYRRAGIRPQEIDVGAAIITGESAGKENAEAVLRELSELAGDFVVAVAGADLEGIMAAKGGGVA